MISAILHREQNLRLPLDNPQSSLSSMCTMYYMYTQGHTLAAQW